MSHAATLARTSQFSWITDAAGPLVLEASPSPGWALDHDAEFHSGLEPGGRVFCEPLAVVEELSASANRAHVRWSSIPFCRKRDVPFATIGWNFVVTVDDGRSVVVTRRHNSLSHGGKWHVSANESAIPQDFLVNDGSPARVLAPELASRALAEELGVVCSPATLAPAVRTVALFQVGAGLGVTFHVRGELLGWTGSMVLKSHAAAPDAWEGVPKVVSFSPDGILGLGQPEDWTPWGLPCVLSMALAAR